MEIQTKHELLRETVKRSRSYDPIRHNERIKLNSLKMDKYNTSISLLSNVRIICPQIL